MSWPKMFALLLVLGDQSLMMPPQLSLVCSQMHLLIPPV